MIRQPAKIGNKGMISDHSEAGLDISRDNKLAYRDIKSLSFKTILVLNANGEDRVCLVFIYSEKYLICKLIICFVINVNFFLS